TGDRPYVCDHDGCNRSFTQSGALSIHKRTHTKVKPYVCDQCNQFFTHSSAFTVHKRIHTGERPYVCGLDGCNRSFIQSTHLTRHRRTQHNRKDE
ncbi:C2H2-type zinc finger protein, partial [Sansalvadorimonas verongulae]|nr:C2H2-type zinc finger protein [Sansalvadorimonas verongulae]